MLPTKILSLDWIVLNPYIQGIELNRNYESLLNIAGPELSHHNRSHRVDIVPQSSWFSLRFATSSMWLY
jgi:hypothetical protein